MILLATTTYYPFVVLLSGIAFIVVTIAVFRIHAFLALMLAAIFVGLLIPNVPGDPEVSNWIRAVELPMKEMGATAGQIGFAIALASVIGIALMESGAADKIIRKFLAVLGENKAGIALLACGFFLAIPVFFDTVFFLLIPLAIALSVRVGKNYMFYVMAICGGGVITHVLVAPTPGPLVMAEAYGIDLGLSIVGGILAGLLPAALVPAIARWLDKRIPVTIPQPTRKQDDIPESELPSFFLSILPVVLPVILISLASVVGILPKESISPFVKNLVLFLGNKNIALLIGMIISLWLLGKQLNLNLAQLMQKIEEPLTTAGIIILITSAGGAFGAMIKHSGIGDAILSATAGQEINYILLAWGISSVMKIAQGSSTVAMITTANIMVPLIGDGSTLPYPLLLIFLATGFGSLAISWMNDSGFWVVGKMSGFTEKQTLRSLTVTLALIAVIGLAEVLLISLFF
ncbi:MAG: SLC13 family permease [Bacteroidia bacterium]|nr:SLC13 family permease [Bacteroidia bacterium]